MARHLVICRHTRTDDNDAGIWSGQRDVPLNETGKKQSIVVTNAIARDGNICAILCSDLRRAAYLGGQLRTLTGAPLRLLPDLREVHVGRLQGLRKEEFPEFCKGPKYQTTNPRFDFTRVGGETAAQVVARYKRALRKAEAALELGGPDARVVIVGHGSALRLVFRLHFGVIDRLHEQGDFQEFPWPPRR